MNKLASALSLKRQQSIEESSVDHDTPCIIITGVIGDITYPLKQRGFVPVYSFTDNSSSVNVLIVKLSPKLYMKSAIELGYPLLDITESKAFHVSRVQHECLSILMRMKEDMENFDKAWLMQRNNSKGDYSSNQADISDINTYYGSKIALFFAFQKFLQSYLLVPGCLGLALFTYQLYVGAVNNEYNSLFMLFMVLWSIILTHLWYRKNSTYCFEWGCSDADDDKKTTEIIEVSVTSKSLTGMI